MSDKAGKLEWNTLNTNSKDKKRHEPLFRYRIDGFTHKETIEFIEADCKSCKISSSKEDCIYAERCDKAKHEAKAKL